jgi:hypothetical protein
MGPLHPASRTRRRAASPPRALWNELVYFAGTYSGYIVCPNRQLLEALTDQTLAAFRDRGLLPDGLTMLRAALHGEQRRDYWTGWSGGPSPERMELVHAIVERIRGLVRLGEHRKPDPRTVGGVQDKVMNAYERLLTAYADWGGHRVHGWTDYPDPRNFHGPVIWSERDCGLRLAMELEREWPLGVHMEFAIGKATRDDYVKTERASSASTWLSRTCRLFARTTRARSAFEHAATRPSSR